MQKIRAKNKLADALGIGEHMSVYAIAKKAGIPSATARRYLEQMEKEGRVLRDGDAKPLAYVGVEFRQAEDKEEESKVKEEQPKEKQAVAKKATMSHAYAILREYDYAKIKHRDSVEHSVECVKDVLLGFPEHLRLEAVELVLRHKGEPSERLRRVLNGALIAIPHSTENKPKKKAGGKRRSGRKGEVTVRQAGNNLCVWVRIPEGWAEKGEAVKVELDGEAIRLTKANPKVRARRVVFSDGTVVEPNND